jgi:hypothetical protein
VVHKPQPRVKKPAVTDSRPVPAEFRDTLGSVQTWGELKEEIKRQKKELAEARKALQKLQPDEIGMTRDQLQIKWAEEQRQKRFGPRQMVELTEEEKGMKWAKEERDLYIERQRLLGRKIITCEVCAKSIVEGDPYHNCFVAWTGPAGRRQGVPARPELMVAQTKAGGVRVAPQVALDFEKFSKEYENMRERFELMQAELKKRETEAADNVADDIPMTKTGLKRIASNIDKEQTGASPDF